MATGYAKGRAKRDEILRVALDVIAENGFRRSSLREIGERVGLTNAGVLHHFGSKEELFAEVLRVRDERSAASSGRALDSFSEVIRRNAAVPGLAHLYASLSSDGVDPEHPAHDFFVERYRALEEMLTTELRDRQEAGEVHRSLDAAMLARMLIALADGLQVQWLFEPEFSMADHVDALLELIRGYRPSV